MYIIVILYKKNYFAKYAKIYVYKKIKHAFICAINFRYKILR